MLEAPLPLDQARAIQLVKGQHCVDTHASAIIHDFKLTILLKVGDNISTDEIMPAGARVLPYRSNIPKISEFCFDVLDKTYYKRSHEIGAHAIVSGENYGQGSSREHAALAPRYLGLQLVIAKSFARIHWQNLVNFGILPLNFANPDDYAKINSGDMIVIHDVSNAISHGNEITAMIEGKNLTIQLRHQLSPRQIEILLEGGLINWVRKHAV